MKAPSAWLVLKFQIPLRKAGRFLAETPLFLQTVEVQSDTLII